MQQLLLGCGVNQCYGEDSWPKMLGKIACADLQEEEKKRIVNSHEVPAPLKAILVTQNHVNQALKGNSEHTFYGSIKSPDQRELLEKILDCGFDRILTTNYSYEIELAALGLETINDSCLKKISKSTRKADRVEPKYLLHTYNQVFRKGKEQQIWHIHGEARKSGSMILGHYYYGNILFRIKDLVNSRKDKYMRLGSSFVSDSWVDSFIMDDTYVLGFGFGMSEIDLWWLLNRKFKEKGNTGKLYFYEPFSDENKDKRKLLELFEVEVIDLGFTKEKNKVFPYEDFYHAALVDIQKKMKENKEGENSCPNL